MSFIETSYEGTIPSNTAVVVVTSGATNRSIVRSGIVRNAGNAALDLTITQAGQILGKFTIQVGNHLVLEQPLVVPASGSLTLTLSAVPSSPWTYHFFAGQVA